MFLILKKRFVAELLSKPSKFRGVNLAALYSDVCQLSKIKSFVRLYWQSGITGVRGNMLILNCNILKTVRCVESLILVRMHFKFISKFWSTIKNLI